jgi:hypothetical protein
LELIAPVAIIARGMIAPWITIASGRGAKPIVSVSTSVNVVIAIMLKLNLHKNK